MFGTQLRCLQKLTACQYIICGMLQVIYVGFCAIFWFTLHLTQLFSLAESCTIVNIVHGLVSLQIVTDSSMKLLQIVLLQYA
jgi:hypothetical protein